MVQRIGSILPLVTQSVAETVKARTDDPEACGLLIWHTPGNEDLAISLYNLDREQAAYILTLFLQEIKKGTPIPEVQV